MALIKCPECGKEISSYAASCPSCGYPVQSLPSTQHTLDTSEQKETIAESENKINLRICPICIGIYNTVVHHCCSPFEPLVEIDFSIEEYNRRLNEGLEQYSDEYLDQIFHANAIEYDKIYGERRRQNIQKTNRFIYDNYIKPLNLGDPSNPRYRQRLDYYGVKPYTPPAPRPPKPKCPICGSEDLSKITTTSKVAKIAVFGIFAAGDAGKTWKCNNCGSKF